MKIRPVGAQLFHADGQTWRSWARYNQKCISVILVRFWQNL